MTIDPAIFFFFLLLFLFLLASRSFSVTEHFHFHVSRVSLSLALEQKRLRFHLPASVRLTAFFCPSLPTLFRSIQRRDTAYRKQEREREKERKKDRKKTDRNINNRKKVEGGEHSSLSFQSVGRNSAWPTPRRGSIFVPWKTGCFKIPTDVLPANEHRRVFVAILRRLVNFCRKNEKREGGGKNLVE